MKLHIIIIIAEVNSDFELMLVIDNNLSHGCSLGLETVSRPVLKRLGLVSVSGSKVSFTSLHKTLLYSLNMSENHY